MPKAWLITAASRGLGPGSRKRFSRPGTAYWPLNLGAVVSLQLYSTQRKLSVASGCAALVGQCLKNFFTG
jgi:hypothetical protein